jgi:hypothetical protein
MIFYLPVIVAQGQVSDSTMLVVNKTTDFEISGDGQATLRDAKGFYCRKEIRRRGLPDKMKILYSDSGIYNLFYCVTPY